MEGLTRPRAPDRDGHDGPDWLRVTYLQNRGGGNVTNVDIAKLSDAARKENTDALCRLAGLGSMTKKQIEG